MAKLTVTIDSENDSFSAPNMAAWEFARLLRKVQVKIEHGAEGGGLMDANGNACGEWHADFGSNESEER